MGCSAIELKKIIESCSGIGNLDVEREILPLCTEACCGGLNYEHGFGFFYKLTFLSITIDNPIVTIVDVVFDRQNEC
jgi:hypothetical protein